MENNIGHNEQLQTDKELIRERFEARFSDYDRLAGVQKEICAELASRLHPLLPEANTILELGAGTGFLTRHLAGYYPDARWWLNDLAPVAENFLLRYVDPFRTQLLWGDAETLTFPTGMELIASACTIQWFTDPQSFFLKCARSSARGGWIALSTFGPENFREIRATTGEGLVYRTCDQLQEMLAFAGYKICFAEEWERVLHLPDPSSVLRHIKSTGVNSVKKAAWGHDRFLKFERDYRNLFSTSEEEVLLTFNPIILIARLEA